MAHIAATTYSEMQRAADEVAAVMLPENFYAVGPWYQDFSQTSDEEVREVLAQAACLQPCRSLSQQDLRICSQNS
jgi:putative phosphoribosyl transferase